MTGALYAAAGSDPDRLVEVAREFSPRIEVCGPREITLDLSGLARLTKRTPEQIELEKLRRRNERLERELAKNKAALTIMGKAHELLELLSESSDSDRPPTR